MAKKVSEPYKLKQIFSEFWSNEYNGQVYEGGSRDLRSAKEYLELNPEFFTDEVSIMNFKSRAERFMKDRYWYKPNGNPPMYHPMYCFLNNIEKYAELKKVFDSRKPIKHISRVRIYCTDCGSNHYPEDGCKIDTPEEISKMITNSLNRGSNG